MFLFHFISRRLYNSLTLDEESKLLLQPLHMLSSLLWSPHSVSVSSFCTHLNELPILCPDEEHHPGLLPDRQHCRHVVMPEDDRLWPQSLPQLNTDM